MSHLSIPALVAVAVVAVVPIDAAGQATGRDIGIAVRASTIGVGIEVGKLVASRVSLRVGGNAASYDHSRAVDDVNYDAKIRFRNFTALVDLYPRARGSFHLTGGVVQRGDRIDATGVPDTDGSYNFDGTEYLSLIHI